MDIRLLGPIEASLDGRPVALGAPQQRAVLAMLALQVNQTVSADRLSEGLWGERAPATAPKMVQLYVSQLRKLLRGSEAEILTRGRGYELRLAVDRVDAVRFERLVAAAEHADGAPNGEARAALALWRGSPLADVADEPFASAEIRRLEDLRLQAAELAIDADLAAGRHGEVLGELRSLIADEPLRERLRAQQMLALYRSGRQADALAAYRDARTALVEAIGVEPGPELRHLHEAILRQDPRLEPAEASKRSSCRPSSTRRRRWWAERPTWSGCAGTGSARSPAPAGSCSSPASAASARHAWWPSSPQRCCGTAEPCGTSLLATRGGGVARGAGRCADGSRTDPAGARRRRR